MTKPTRKQEATVLTSSEFTENKRKLKNAKGENNKNRRTHKIVHA
jgi:hypothetical protein